MSLFIKTTDYDATIHREILNSLLRADSDDYDSEIIEICEDRAIAEMRSYMNKTYDCDAIFSARGDNRHPLVLMFAIDISVYHIFCQHNPFKLSKIREDRYKRAIEWLKGIMEGDITIDGAPLLSDAELNSNSPWQIQADPARPVVL
jgi:phage gp36-like protein